MTQQGIERDMVEKMSFQTIAENSSVQPVSPQRCSDVYACAVSNLCPVYFSSSATLRIPTKRTLFSPTSAVQGSSEVEFLPANKVIAVVMNAISVRSLSLKCCENPCEIRFILPWRRYHGKPFIYLFFLTHCGQLKTIIGISFQYRPSVKPSFSNRH